MTSKLKLRPKSLPSRQLASRCRPTHMIFVFVVFSFHLYALLLCCRYDATGRTSSKIWTSSGDEPQRTPDELIMKIKHNVIFNDNTSKQLPTWESITSMYGNKPVIHGLETCEHYRNTVKPEDRNIGPAGLFNTGTNLFFKLISKNCNMMDGGEIRWQAPWGKHSPPSNRLKRVAWDGEGINQTAFFPFMMIKDPFSWMNSQCRHDYGVTFWDSTYDEEHCPNLIRGQVTDRDETAPVRLFKKGKKHNSLLDVWNWYYGEWEEERTTKNSPHLTIRYEDLLFHGKEVITIACECVGGTVTPNFEFEKESAKGNHGPHEGANDFDKAFIQYGDAAKRMNGFTERDLDYAGRNNATAELMKKYVYNFPV